MAGMNDILTMDRLPAMPASLARTLPLLLDPESPWESLERVVRQDEALTASILRLANSAQFGAPGKQFDLRRAMSRLGRDHLRRTVLQQQVHSAVAGENAAFGLQRGAMWRSSLAGGIAAELLAARHSPGEASIAYVSGLLRDVGKLALNVKFGGGYFDEVKARGQGKTSFIEAERAALGFDHAKIGGALARRWKLPERIARAIELHHEPPPLGADHDMLSDIVHAADTICRWAGLGVGVDGMEYRLADHVRESLGLDRRSAEQDIAVVWEQLRTAEELMSGQTKQGAAA